MLENQKAHGKSRTSSKKQKDHVIEAKTLIEAIVRQRSNNTFYDRQDV